MTDDGTRDCTQKREEGKDQETIQSSSIPDRNTLWESDKTRGNIKLKRAKRPALSHHKAARQHKRSTALEQSAKITGGRKHV